MTVCDENLRGKMVLETVILICRQILHILFKLNVINDQLICGSFKTDYNY